MLVDKMATKTPTKTKNGIKSIMASVPSIEWLKGNEINASPI